MGHPRNKFYVVWVGRDPGVYDNWEDAFDQINEFPGALFKSFSTQEAAVKAFRMHPDGSPLLFLRELAKHKHLLEHIDYTQFPDVNLTAIAVDGACERNPGPVEYRGVRVLDGVEIFRKGPFTGGSNNIGEYLAIVHAAALLKKRGDSKTVIYSDSKTAMSWVRRGRAFTKITQTPENQEIFELVRRADAWLAANKPIANPILKWETDKWGEIPADFGRK